MSEHDCDEWVTCWQCFGHGELEDCFEDTCVCLNPPCCWQRCDVCEGKGGWKRNPDADRAAEASAP